MASLLVPIQKRLASFPFILVKLQTSGQKLIGLNNAQKLLFCVVLCGISRTSLEQSKSFPKLSICAQFNSIKNVLTSKFQEITVFVLCFNRVQTNFSKSKMSIHFKAKEPRFCNKLFSDNFHSNS
jgi:hypothetical protein